MISVLAVGMTGKTTAGPRCRGLRPDPHSVTCACIISKIDCLLAKYVLSPNPWVKHRQWTHKANGLLILTASFSESAEVSLLLRLHWSYEELSAASELARVPEFASLDTSKDLEAAKMGGTMPLVDRLSSSNGVALCGTAREGLSYPPVFSTRIAPHEGTSL